MRQSAALIGAATTVALIALSFGSAAPQARGATSWATAAGVWSVPDVSLAPDDGAAGRRLARSRSTRALTPRLPGGDWALSGTVGLQPGSGIRVIGPDGATVVRMSGQANGRLTVHTAATRAARALPAAAVRRGVHRIELVGGRRSRLAIDGETVAVGPVRRIRLVADGPRSVRLRSLTITPLARRDLLLLHRLGDLQARTPPGRFPLGEGADGRLRFSGGWTSGFWPGALWEAARLVPDGPYAGWALSASLARRGGEDTPIHDVGFMFGRSVATAFDRLCRSPAQRATPRCRDLRASGLAAADTLVRLAGTSATGMIPTDARGAEAQTIVDSLMNVGLLTWAARVSGQARYAQLARAHATLVAALLLRPDGSTIQVATHDRASGRLLGLGTRQGLSDTSTWARGQAWAIYGLADTGRALRDPGLVADAERAAAYWMRTAPPRAVPPYDLDAGAAAPRDSSAGAIAAAGMYRLARACRSVPRACATPGRWAGAASSTLDAALRAVSATPPLGRLGEQAYSVGPRHGAWDDRAELIWGLDFALEAVAERRQAS